MREYFQHSEPLSCAQVGKFDALAKRRQPVSFKILVAISATDLHGTWNMCIRKASTMYCHRLQISPMALIGTKFKIRERASERSEDILFRSSRVDRILKEHIPKIFVFETRIFPSAANAEMPWSPLEHVDRAGPPPDLYVLLPRAGPPRTEPVHQWA